MNNNNFNPESLTEEQQEEFKKQQEKALRPPLFDDNQKAYNDDIDFSGIKISQYPKEEKWYKELEDKLKKYVKSKPVNRIRFKNDVMHPRDYEYIVNNFIALYNQNENPKMRLLRQGKNEKQIINMSVVSYKAHFFVEFPERESYHAYEIGVGIERDVKKPGRFKFDENIVECKFVGAVGLSDIKFGVPNDMLKKQQNIRFYKDTDKYGNYKFMFNDNEIASILSEQSGKVRKITESDKTGVKNVPVGTKRDIYQNRFQRGEPPKEPKYVPEKIYTQPSKSEGKLRIGNKCMEVDTFGKIVPRNCEDEIEARFKYQDNKLKYKEKCVAYHADGQLDFIPCDNPVSCKPNSTLNNCMDFKFVKYGGLEIYGNNSCLNPNKNTWIGEPCENSGKADII